MFGGSVVGLSSLRKNEPKSTEPSERAQQLQSYLSKYTSSKSDDSSKPKKKKKKVARPQPAGVRIFEEDNSGFRGLQTQPGDAEDPEDEEAPVVANPEEAERAMRQVQKLQAGTDLEAWAEVPTIVGDIPTTSQAARGNADLSPKRKGRHDSPDLSPQRQQPQQRASASAAKRHEASNKRLRHDSPDIDPLRRSRHDSPDISPPRAKRQASPDISPPRRARHDSPDASPPRTKRQADADASPPRQKRHDSPDAEPPRRRRHDSPDASPPRRKRQADDDASPPRKKRHDSPDSSPKRKSDAGDLSPARKRNKVSPDAGANAAPAAGARKPRFMPDGGRAGQVTASELAAELQAKAQREAKQFAALGTSVTGRGADTIYRDKSGKRVTLEELKAQQEASKKPVAETPEWGGGMAQKREAEERRQQMQAEAAKPFARSREDVDQHLRHRERFGDPMAHLVKKRPVVEESIIPAALQKRMKKAGFIIPQDVPAHSWIKRNLGPPGNRYNIRPGRHWDGVDRSTGFEKDMFSIINERRNRSQEAHMWSQGDM